jgi:hypothetical protein
VPRWDEVVVSVPWDQVDVVMEDLLPCCGSVRLGNVHASRTQPVPQQLSHSPHGSHRSSSFIFGQFPDIRSVAPGYDEGVTWRGLPSIKKGNGSFVLIHSPPKRAPLNDRTEDAVAAASAQHDQRPWSAAVTIAIRIRSKSSGERSNDRAAPSIGRPTKGSFSKRGKRCRWGMVFPCIS